MSSITLAGVEKRFDEVIAVSDFSLTIEDGEFLVLLGPSGCGKSTVLRMVAGLERPSAGEIRIGDRLVNDVEPKDRDVAMVFQSYALYPHMSVRANIEFPLRARNIGKAERATSVERAAQMLGLADLLDRKPGQLSGGQRQRVALARAVVRRPEAFLMDEPLSNLDAKLRVQTRVEIVELQRELQTTVVYVTHDQVEAMTMGHRIAILERGVLQQVDSPQAVYDEPANLFVARFIGTPPMNTFPGELVRRPGVVAGVRPEHLVIGDEGPITATVDVVEHLGHEQLVMCRLPDGEIIIVRRPSHTPAVQPLDAVHLAVTGDVHCFDVASGERVRS